MIGYGKRVLVVGDEEFVDSFLIGELDLHCFVVATVADGLQALNELRRRHFDAVIAYVQTPNLNGLALLYQCRLVWPQLPIILVSEPHEDVVDLAINRGAYACLAKPVETRKLIHVVSGALAHIVDPGLQREQLSEAFSGGSIRPYSTI
ncbi:MAG: response regulator [Nitrospira sp.]|nr:response regulator [Nitrospira sp.]